MNESRNSPSPASRAWWTNKRVICVALVLAAAVYVLAQPKLEQWTGLDLPDLIEREDANNQGGGADGKNRNGSAGEFKIDFDALKKGSGSGFKLKEVGRDKFESPEGLLYDTYRIDHVLRHTRDDTSRPVHGVFDTQSQTELLELLDRAYKLIKAKDRAVYSKKPDDRGRIEHAVNMPSRIGYVGGGKGADQNNPATKRLELILDGKRVITAYPTWPPRR